MCVEVLCLSEPGSGEDSLFFSSPHMAPIFSVREGALLQICSD